jgi:hypothetical protein
VIFGNSVIVAVRETDYEDLVAKVRFAEGRTLRRLGLLVQAESQNCSS